MRGLIITFVVVGLGAGPLRAGDWPQFRGPAGDGRTSATNLPVHWGGFLHPPLWQSSLPGTGWSSPIIVGERIWLTAAEQTALSEDERLRRLQQNPYGEDEFQVHGSVTLLALEVDARTGELLQRIELFHIENPPPIHSHNSYASPTPVSDGQRVYCHFGTLGTAAVDIGSGAVVWKKNFTLDDITGPGNSPVLCGGRVILACDGVDEQFVVALEGTSGDIAWRTSRPPIECQDGKQRRGFSTPLVIEYEGRQQLIAPGAQWVVSYDPADGHELWRVNFGSGHAVVPRPVYQHGTVYACTGYPQHDMWAIRVDGSGDVTNTHVLWKFTRQAPEISSPVIVGNELYFVTTMGIVTCLDIESGEVIWQQRLGGTFAASPLAADDKLYFTDETGSTIVLRAGRTYDELARNELFGQTLASLAIHEGTFILRTDTALYCVGDQP